MLCAGDKHFNAGDKRVENACSKFSHTHTQIATIDFQTELLSISPLKQVVLS